MQLVIAQTNPLVGDIEGNCEQILAAAQQAVTRHHADLVVFPELALSGYPPEDLLLRESLEARIAVALERLQQQTPVAIVVGYPGVRGAGCVNLAGFIEPGQAPVEYAKQQLPNYRVFDEKRYFQPGNSNCIVNFQGLRIALAICEDVWSDDLVAAIANADADLLLTLNASPFHQHKHTERRAIIGGAASRHGLPIVYCNLVGGQDELVFDGASMVLSTDGEVVVQAPAFEECLWPVAIDRQAGQLRFTGECRELPSIDAASWQALTLGLADYVNKNGFKKVALGLSGGIDSAVVLALAVDALGADRVQAIMMPYHYTAAISLEDAAAEAAILGVDYQVVPIADAVESFGGMLAPLFAGAAPDTTEENLQARCRGTLLMAISNKQGALVLPTGNKSEMAVGYATLYGDMVGGFAVLKDVFKTWVYRLARYRNQRDGIEVIPERVITRPPSAELAPDQQDSDSLPDYDVLDAILSHYIEADMSAVAIIRAGFDEATVNRVVRLVDRCEFKRRQAAIGPRITARAFGRDRRYPITNGWKPGI